MTGILKVGDTIRFLNWRKVVNCDEEVIVEYKVENTKINIMKIY